jgi:hypothetical protein
LSGFTIDGCSPGLHAGQFFVWIVNVARCQEGDTMAYRIRLLVPASYTDEARTMIEEHPRASVVERSICPLYPGADLLVVISSEPRILHGLHRWWMDRRNELRANPPMSIVQPDDSFINFNDHSADQLEEYGRREELPQAS